MIDEESAGYIDEHKLLRDQERAAQARMLLESELLTEAFGELEAAYIAAWRTTTIDDIGAREKLFLAINVVGKVREHLMTIVANGRLAQAQLQELAALAERKKRTGKT